MRTKAQNIKYMQLRKFYIELLDANAEDESEIITDNKRFAPLVSKALRVDAKVINYAGEAPVLPFIYLSNESTEFSRVDTPEDLDFFVDEFDRINLGEGVIVFNF